MFDENDHAGSMTFAAKAMWVVVGFVFFIMFMPALMIATAPQATAEREPIKHTYTVPLVCYESVDGNARPVLICDRPPMNPVNPSH